MDGIQEPTHDALMARRLDGCERLDIRLLRLTSYFVHHAHFSGAVGAMELLSEIWDKTTDAFTALTEGVSEGLVRLFGSSNERRIRHMRATVDRINELEPAMQALSGGGAAGQDGRAPRSAGRRARRSKSFCPRRSPLRGSRAGAISTCVTSTCS